MVESYPPLYRPSENSLKLPRLLRTPMGGQEDAIKGAVMSRERANFGPLPAPLDPKMEAGGGGDRSPGPRRFPTAGPPP